MAGKYVNPVLIVESLRIRGGSRQQRRFQRRLRTGFTALTHIDGVALDVAPDRFGGDDDLRLAGTPYGTNPCR